MLVHWLAAALTVATGIASWRWIGRPLRRVGREAMVLLRQIRTNSGAVAQLAREVQALAGAVVQLSVAILEDVKQLREDHDELVRHTRELTTLVIDLNADVRRVEKRIARRPT